MLGKEQKIRFFFISRKPSCLSCIGRNWSRSSRSAWCLYTKIELLTVLRVNNPHNGGHKTSKLATECFISHFAWSLPWRRAVEELRSILYRSASAVERGLDAPWPLLASKAIYRVQPFGLGSRKRSRLHCTAAGIDWLRRKRYSRLQSAEFGSHLLVKKNNVLGTVVPKACQDFFRGSSSRRRWCPKLRSKSVNQGNSNIKFILLSAAEIERLVENPAPLCSAIFLFTCKIWCRQSQMWNCKCRERIWFGSYTKLQLAVVSKRLVVIDSVL